MLGIGLMSGTSADGVDAALVQIWDEAGEIRARLLDHRATGFSEQLQELIHSAFQDRLRIDEICLLHALLGDEYARAAADLAATTGTPIDFVACHGQTVWHQPEPPERGVHPLLANRRGTLQLGAAARIAVRLGAPVVHDFRQQDMALGGEGAPLVPWADVILFSHPLRSRAVQNLGGIGNVTYVPAGSTLRDGGAGVIAFDTGPANAWIDAAARVATGGRLSMDLGGELARQGTVNEPLLRELLAWPYFLRRPPKSTGRELFSHAQFEAIRQRVSEPVDLLATLTRFTAATIADQYHRWLGPINELILCGGGSRNPYLVSQIRGVLPEVRVLRAEEIGIDPAAREALTFALLGYATLTGRTSNLPSATGAHRHCSLGSICLP